MNGTEGIKTKTKHMQKGAFLLDGIMCIVVVVCESSCDACVRAYCKQSD